MIQIQMSWWKYKTTKKANIQEENTQCFRILNSSLFKEHKITCKDYNIPIPGRAQTTSRLQLTCLWSYAKGTLFYTLYTDIVVPGIVDFVGSLNVKCLHHCFKPVWMLSCKTNVKQTTQNKQTSKKTPKNFLNYNERWAWGRCMHVEEGNLSWKIP